VAYRDWATHLRAQAKIRVDETALARVRVTP
jgi:hypothetical protein